MELTQWGLVEQCDTVGLGVTQWGRGLVGLSGSVELGAPRWDEVGLNAT